MTTVIWFWLADANTSAGAPWVSWVARAELPAKLNCTSRSGLSAISWSPSSPKTSVNDAAAKTVSVPLSSPPADDEPRGRPLASTTDPPHAARTIVAAADSANRARVVIGPPDHRRPHDTVRVRGRLARCGQRMRRFACSRSDRAAARRRVTRVPAGDVDAHLGRLDRRDGAHPTSRPSSSAASRDMSETTRNGPAWISTWAITASRTTRVTMPVSRLRADEGVVPGSGGSCSCVATLARSAPSMTAGPPPSRRATSRHSRSSGGPCRR